MDDENSLFCIAFESIEEKESHKTKQTRFDKREEKKLYLKEKKSKVPLKRKEKRLRVLQRKQEMLSKMTAEEQKEYYGHMKKQEESFIVHYKAGLLSISQGNTQEMPHI